METLLPLLTAMAATDAPTAERKERAGGLSEFPNEEPSEKELDDWLKDNGPVLRKAHGALMRGETPPELVKYDRQDDLTGYTEIPPPPTAGSAADESRRLAHNWKVKQARADNDAKKTALESGLREAKNMIAEMLITALRPNAPLRLEALLTTHCLLACFTTLLPGSTWLAQTHYI